MSEELKTGMLVRAKEESNGEYDITTARNGCVGEVVAVDGDEIRLKVTMLHKPEYIGEIYLVESKFFESIGMVEKKEDNMMKIQVRDSLDVLDFEVGDLLVSDRGQHALVMHDSYKQDYRAVILQDKYVTDYADTKKELIEDLASDGFGTVVRVVKASDLVLAEV